MLGQVQRLHTTQPMRRSPNRSISMSGPLQRGQVPLVIGLCLAAHPLARSESGARSKIYDNLLWSVLWRGTPAMRPLFLGLFVLLALVTEATAADIFPIKCGLVVLGEIESILAPVLEIPAVRAPARAFSSGQRARTE